MTENQAIQTVEPYDYHELWGGVNYAESSEVRAQRMEETARWYASRCPAWAGAPTHDMEGEHVIERSRKYPYVMFQGGRAVEVEASCMRLSCNWGVVMRGDDCEMRLEAAIQEHVNG